MADNYLERRMEDLRSGKLQSSHSALVRKASTASSRGSLHNLRAVVTGGANGIGRQIAIDLKHAGAKVDIIDIDINAGRSMAQQQGVKFYPCDISDPKQFAKTISAILHDRGDIDILVNNAAICDFVALEDNSAERFMQSIAVNLLPLMEGARILLKHRMQLPLPNPYGGRIINISSTRASMSEVGTENYSASKGGVEAMTHALMMSMAKVGVTVNAIAPGWIETNPEVEHSEAEREQHPSHRVGTPTDISRAIIWISQRGNDFLNGQTITIDGGISRRMLYL